ncbi:MAG: preprotein translocase subunit SecG [Thermodesulfobacteriota bacterium]
MFTAVVVLHIVVSIVLIIVVLLQAGKGASIGASFGGASSQTLFGSAGPATFFGKMTAACAVIFMITSMSLTYMTAAKRRSSVMEGVETIEKAPAQEAPSEETPLQKPEETAAPEKAPAEQ